MKMKSRLVTLTCTGLLCLGLGACGGGYSASSDTTPTPDPTATAQSYVPWRQGVFYVKLPDGYDLLCVYVNGFGDRDGGPSCDWPGHTAWLNDQSATASPTS